MGAVQWVTRLCRAKDAARSQQMMSSLIRISDDRSRAISFDEFSKVRGAQCIVLERWLVADGLGDPWAVLRRRQALCQHSTL